MNQLTEFLVNSILEEDKNEIIGIYGGGFKPPIKGHLEVLQGALDKYPEMDKVIVSVGSGVRDEIDQEESLLVWDIYQKKLPVKVEVGASKTQPIRDIYNLAKENPDKTIYWIIGAREGREDDLQDIAARTKSIDKYGNIEVKVIQTKDPKVSGTNARKALIAGNKEEFFTYLPDNLTDEEKEEIYTIVRPAVKEQLNEHSMGNSIDILPKLAELTQHMIDKGYNIEPLPGLKIIDDDVTNAEDFFGKTAYYDPNTQTIVLYTEGRHPKDIARSYAHEMIHHIQNLEGRLGNITTTNTQEDDHLNDIEAEANLKGTMTFRNWTDSLNENLTQEVPQYFYHATYKPLLPSIKKTGLDTSEAKLAWEDSEPGIVYLANDPYVAESYAETSEMVDDEWLDEIIILKVASKDLDLSKLHDDRNVRSDEPSDTFEYHGVIPWNVLKLYKGDVNEIGDASAKTLKYSDSYIDKAVKTLAMKVSSQEEDTSEYYDLPPIFMDSEKAQYFVKVGATVEVPLHIAAFQKKLPRIELRIDFGIVGDDKDSESNLGEQYRVMATLSEISIKLINKINNFKDSSLVMVKFYAKDDKENKYANPNSRRGKLYQAFIKKQLSKLEDNWEMRVWSEAIVIYKPFKEGFNKKLGKDPFGLEQFARELMTEGAYDSLVTKLTNATIKKWVADSKKKPLPKKSFVDIDIDDVDGKGREIEFNYVGIVEFDKKIDGYEVDGTSNSGEDKGKIPFVATMFRINPKILPQAWSKISADVSDVIRHEIEHLTQAGDNVRGQVYDDEGNLIDKGKYMDDDKMIRDMINKLKILPKSDYYKLEKEVDAMLQGLYLKAKKTRKPFADVINNYLDIAPGIDTKEDKEAILNLWRSRRKALSLPVFENEEKVMDYKIFLDMDGVLVDFDEQFKELTGMMPREFESKYSTDKFWEAIDDAGVGFWRGMKWMPGGEELYKRASQFDHALLSSPSRSELSKIGKRLWRRDKTPNTKLILARSYNKRKYAAPNHILIDDRADNIQQWRDAGGIGILYKSADQVNAELDKLGL